MTPPSVFVVGAPKCGTTSLSELLRSCEGVFVPPEKELHYFSYPHLMSKIGGPGDYEAACLAVRTEAHYRRVFTKAEQGECIVDFSPSYFPHYKCAAEIRRFCPEAQIVILLRHPVDKAYSQYTHLVSEGRETLSFAEALALEGQRAARGFGDMWLYRESMSYVKPVQEYLRIFGTDQVYVVIFEDLLGDVRGEMGRLLTWLRVGRSTVPDSIPWSNQSGQPRSALAARWLLAPTFFSRLAKRILPRGVMTFAKSGIRRLLLRAKPRLDADLRAQLAAEVLTEVRDLESLIGRRTGWL